MGFRYIGQVGLELLTSDDPPASASQSARITGMSHRAWLSIFIINTYFTNHLRLSLIILPKIIQTENIGIIILSPELACLILSCVASYEDIRKLVLASESGKSMP